MSDYILSYLGIFIALLAGLTAVMGDTWNQKRKAWLGFIKFTLLGWVAAGAVLSGSILVAVETYRSYVRASEVKVTQEKLTYSAISMVYEPLYWLMAYTIPFQIQLAEKGFIVVGAEWGTKWHEEEGDYFISGEEYEKVLSEYRSNEQFPYRLGLIGNLIASQKVGSNVVSQWLQPGVEKDMYRQDVLEWRELYVHFLKQLDRAMTIYGSQISTDVFIVFEHLERHPIVRFSDRALSTQSNFAIAPVSVVGGIQSIKEIVEKNLKPHTGVYALESMENDIADALKVLFSDIPVPNLDRGLLREHALSCRERYGGFFDDPPPFCVVPTGRGFTHIIYKYDTLDAFRLRD